MFGNAFDIPVIISLQILLFIFLTFSKSKVFNFDKIGLFWVLLIGLAIIRRILHLNGSSEPLNYFVKFIFYPLGYGPCFYLYTKYITNPRRFNSRDLIHFFPFFLCILFPFALDYNLSANLDSDSKSSPVVYFFVFGSSFSLISYSLLTRKLLKLYNQKLQDHFSYQTLRMTVSWLNGFIYSYLFVLLLQFILFLFRDALGKNSVFPQSLTTLLFIGYFYLVGYFLLKQGSLFRSEETRIIQKKEKYSKSGLTNKKIGEIQRKLISFMEESKIYLRNDLNIEDIVRELEIPGSHLSQVLNQSMGKNFFLFVNEYRVNEVIRKLNDPKYTKHGIFRIALESGFNSKSSFNAIFRKVTGKTPNEFRS